MNSQENTARIKKEAFPIYKICITGGPCAGKTTALDTLRQVLQNRGFKVFVVPQTPTMLMNSGAIIVMDKLTKQQISKFQSELIKFQIYIEDYFSRLAEMSKHPSVILWQFLLNSDRGVMDPYAYMTNQIWQIMLDQEGWNIINLRDKRYDAVIFMVTAADGAEKYYTLQNNQARYQSFERAIATDKRTQEAYNGHPHFQYILLNRIIDNNKNYQFKDKINQVTKAVEKFIGIPYVKIEKKFLIKKIEKDDLPVGIPIQEFDVEETFLFNKQSNVIAEKLRKRGQQNIFSYGHSIQYKNEQNIKHQIKTLISAQEYLMMLMRSDESKKPIKKKRMSILYEKNVFIVDTIFLEQKVYLLRCASDQKIPEFIKIEKDVTNSEEYKTVNMAKTK